jgi:hypothetical protein
LESSPSKKRAQEKKIVLPENRPALFGNRTNKVVCADDPFDDEVGELTADLSMHGIHSPIKPKPRRVSKQGIKLKA